MGHFGQMILQRLNLFFSQANLAVEFLGEQVDFFFHPFFFSFQ